LEQKNIADFSDDQLKAIAYDKMVVITQYNNDLKVIQDELIKRSAQGAKVPAKGETNAISTSN
jgi:hypothetical protein